MLLAYYTHIGLYVFLPELGGYLENTDLPPLGKGKSGFRVAFVEFGLFYLYLGFSQQCVPSVRMALLKNVYPALRQVRRVRVLPQMPWREGTLRNHWGFFVGGFHFLFSVESSTS